MTGENIDALLAKIDRLTAAKSVALNYMNCAQVSLADGHPVGTINNFINLARAALEE